MKTKPILLALAFIILILIPVVHAPWSTLGTGYAITTNYHGIDVLPGTPITVTAGTLDADVVNVTFRWHRPPDGNGPVAWEDVVSVWENGTTGQWNNGTWALIWYANKTRALDEYGDWGIQAFFQNSKGKDRAGLKDVISIKATSINVVPEVPYGTIAILIAMLGALTIFAIKKKRIPLIRRPL
jgi:hypothetical protein